MTSTRWKALTLMVVMLASTAAAHVWKPSAYLADSREKIDLERIFPTQIRGWKLDANVPVQIISPDQQALLNKIYSQTLSRVYVNDAQERIMLSVAYGGDQSEGTRAHRPEVCYPAQGFAILSNNVDTLDLSGYGLRVRKLVARQGERIEPITYWVVVGDHVALSGTEQKVEQIRYSFSGLLPDGMLVRVSTIQADERQAFSTQQKFISDMREAVLQPYQSRVFGGG